MPKHDSRTKSTVDMVYHVDHLERCVLHGCHGDQVTRTDLGLFLSTVEEFLPKEREAPFQASEVLLFT